MAVVLSGSGQRSLLLAGWRDDGGGNDGVYALTRVLMRASANVSLERIVGTGTALGISDELL